VGGHKASVFTYWRPRKGEDKADLEHKPVNFINDTAWLKGLKRAGVENLHVDIKTLQLELSLYIILNQRTTKFNGTICPVLLSFLIPTVNRLP